MKHVVALSGGKDSTALALWLVENEPRDYEFVCTPTGNELPEMVDHWLKLGKLLGKPLRPVTSGKSLQGEIRRQKSLPNNRMRWCTRTLKIEPYHKWLVQQAPAVSYVGLRADEETRGGAIWPDGEVITIRYPLREIGWGEADVWAYLDAKGVTIPARTDCAVCYHQTLGEWWRLWKLHPDLYKEGEELEAMVSEERGTERTFRNDSRDTWPASLRQMARRFEAGEIPQGTVRQVDLFRGERRTMTGACRACSL